MQICSKIKQQGWEVRQPEPNNLGPYAFRGNQRVGFDDVAMIRRKSEFVKRNGYGGGMIWALDLDDFRNVCNCETYPLLKTINRVLRNYPSPAPTGCELGKTNNGNGNPVGGPIPYSNILPAYLTQTNNVYQPSAYQPDTPYLQYVRHPAYVNRPFGHQSPAFSYSTGTGSSNVFRPPQAFPNFQFFTGIKK